MPHWEKPLPLGDPVAFCFKLQDVCCSLRLTRQWRWNLSSLLAPGQKTSPESTLSKSMFETQPLNPNLDDDCNSTHDFPTQESFTMASCTSESHSHWVHTRIKCTELDLQKFSSSASYTGAETLGMGAQLKALEKVWSSMCLLKSPALNSTEVSWKGRAERPEIGDHPQRILLWSTVVQQGLV